MGEQVIILPADSTGKKLRTWEETIGANVVNNQYVILRHNPYSFYRGVSGEVTVPAAIGLDSTCYVWHPSSVTKTYYITKIWMQHRVSHTAGVPQYKLGFISAENATPGGTTVTIMSHNRGSVASGATVRYNANAPTRVSGLLDTYIKQAAALTGGLPDSKLVLFDNYHGGIEPITLRASVAEGIEVFTDVTSALTTTPIVIVGFEWFEV